MTVRKTRTLRFVERDVRALLALLGGVACFLVVVTVLYLFVARQPTTLLATALESAIAALVVIQRTK